MLIHINSRLQSENSSFHAQNARRIKVVSPWLAVAVCTRKYQRYEVVCCMSSCQTRAGVCDSRVVSGKFTQLKFTA